MKKGWTYKKLGEVCLKIKDGSHNPPKGVEKSNNLMLSSQNVQNGWLDFSTVRYLSDDDFEKENQRTQAQKGDVLLTIVGTIGRSCVLTGKDGNITFQRSVAVLGPSEELNSFFLMYYLLSKNDSLSNKAQGAAQKGIYLKQLSNIEIAIPPLSEQLRIVERLDAAFAQIDELKAKATRQLFGARHLFIEVLAECMKPRKDWEKKTLKELTLKIGSGATPKGGKRVYIQHGIALVRSMNVLNNAFKYDELAHINNKAAEQLKGVELQEDDVLFNITGASIARCCVLPKDVLPARVNQHVSILRPIKELVLPTFLCYGMLSAHHLTTLLDIGNAGATRQAITKADLEAHVFPIPPIPVQQAIVARLDALSANIKKLEEVQQKTLAECDALKQAILREVFE